MYIFQNVQIIDLCADYLTFIPDNNFRNFIFISELKNIRKNKIQFYGYFKNQELFPRTVKSSNLGCNRCIHLSNTQLQWDTLIYSLTEYITTSTEQKVK